MNVSEPIKPKPPDPEQDVLKVVKPATSGQDLRDLFTSMRIALEKSPADDSKAQKASVSEKDSLAHELEREQLDSSRQDRKHRGRFGNWIFGVVVGWLLLVVMMLLLAGFKGWGFYLSDAVLIAVLTTTTVNILGLLLAVTGYLFPKRP